MSTLKTVNVVHPSSSTNNIVTDANGNVTVGGTVSMASSFLRNRVINGAMMIDQRNAGASVTPTATGYTLDRFGVFLSQASKFSVQQNAGAVTPPTGFSTYYGVTSLSSYSIGASEIFGFAQCIEAFNIVDLAWGTANAKTCTLSFWVRSSLTGQFGGFLKNGGITAGGAYNNYYYPYSYTISAANTWEYKTIVITPPTSGSWETTNGPGLTIAWSLGAGSSVTGGSGWSSTFYNQPSGSVNLVATNGATLYVTGVQFEVGTQATPFEQRLYPQELAMCQRFCYGLPNSGDVANGVWGGLYITNAGRVWVPLPVTMRASPTLSGTSSSNTFELVGAGTVVSATLTNVILSRASVSFDGVGLSLTGSVGQPLAYRGPGIISAEL